MPPKASSPSQDIGPGTYLAVAAAWAVPGAGHWFIGDRARALLFGITIHLLFVTGMFIGGYQAISPQDQPIWAYTQLMAGWPMVPATMLLKATRAQVVQPRQDYYKLQSNLASDAGTMSAAERLTQEREFIQSHPGVWHVFDPRAQDVGSVYCGIAGMLNVLVMLDVVMRSIGARGRPTLAATRPAGPPRTPGSPAQPGGPT